MGEKKESTHPRTHAHYNGRLTNINFYDVSKAINEDLALSVSIEDDLTAARARVKELEARPVVSRVQHRQELNSAWAIVEAERDTAAQLRARNRELVNDLANAKARVIYLPAEVPKGCTPADAKMLREANHRLVDDLAVAREQIRVLVRAARIVAGLPSA